jgi:DNA primase
VKDLILSFDMDGAGKEAARRGFELTQDFEFTVKALTLAEGKDIADFAKEHPEQVADLPAKAQIVHGLFL